MPKDTDTAAQTIHALDALENAATTQAILRRYHLTRLIKHRNEREAQYSSRKSKPITWSATSEMWPSIDVSNIRARIRRISPPGGTSST
jgi:hypothetical protein